jgi:hypothetical protein
MMTIFLAGESAANELGKAIEAAVDGGDWRTPAALAHERMTLALEMLTLVLNAPDYAPKATPIRRP